MNLLGNNEQGGECEFKFFCLMVLTYFFFVCNRENEVEEVKPEGPKEMTLDEWKAMQDKERTKVEFNIRKPNEGTDSQWKKGYVLHKSKSEDVSVLNLHYTPPLGYVCLFPRTKTIHLRHHV